MNIANVTLIVSSNKASFNIKMFEVVKETPLTYRLEKNRTVLKKNLDTVRTIYNNTVAGTIATCCYNTYCLEENIDKAKALLKSTVREKINNILEGTIGLVNSFNSLSDIQEGIDLKLEPSVKSIIDENQIYKDASEQLWRLLDDIDTASDIFKPSESNGIKSFKNFYTYVSKKANKRFEWLKKLELENYFKAVNNGDDFELKIMTNDNPKNK